MERWFTIWGADFKSVEEIGGSSGRQVTRIYDEDGDEFMELPGHALPEALVERAALEVVRGETRGEEVGRAAAMAELQRAAARETRFSAEQTAEALRQALEEPGQIRHSTANWVERCLRQHLGGLRSRLAENRCPP